MSQESNATQQKRGLPPSAAAQRRALEAAHEILMAEGFGRKVSAYFIVKDAARAIDFYKEAFGATEVFRMTDPSDGR
ncbi:hypothetical protein AB9F34_33265, partial [Rhizobium leguminosarum]